MATAGDGVMSSELIYASEVGDLSKVEALFASGVDIDAIDSGGRTAMMAAVHGNHPEVVAALIAVGADVDKQDNMKDNPFLYAGAEGLLDILKLTIAAGANIQNV